MNYMPHRQRVIIGLLVVLIAVSGGSFAWQWQKNELAQVDSKILHDENDLSKIQRAENRRRAEEIAASFAMLAARVDRMDKGGAALAERIARLEKALLDAGR